MTRIFWDTNLFIYLLEDNRDFAASTKELLGRIIRGRLGLFTSVITSSELQHGPLRTGDTALALRYKERLHQTATLLPFGTEEADRCALIRAMTKIDTADAIQLASAAVYGIQLFVTNDQKLLKVRVPGIDFITSIETALQLL